MPHNSFALFFLVRNRVTPVESPRENATSPPLPLRVGSLSLSIDYSLEAAVAEEGE